MKPISPLQWVGNAAGISSLPFLLMSVPDIQANEYSSAGTKPNFIFILSDDQGWTSSSMVMDHKIPDSRSDYYETPNIARLAQRGMRFSNGYAPCALSCPTRRSIQYGQMPIRQGNDRQFRKNYNPGDTKLTIPRLLKSIDPSYRTAHYGKWDLRADIFPEDIGYDESDGNTGNNNGHVSSNKENKFTALFLNNDPKRIETVTARANNFIKRQTEAGNPFYLQISHYAVHVDIQTKESTYLKYQNKKKGLIHSNPGWAGMLENMDSGIGAVLDMVDSLGIADHTYIIFMSDNGGAEAIPPIGNKFDHPSGLPFRTLNYPLRGGKWTLYEGGIRVPCIIAGPGIDPGSQCDTPVTGWDILPTLADLAGNRKPLPETLDGESIRPFLENNHERPERSKALVFHYFGKPHTAIRVGDYKLIKFWNLNRTELYNLKEDLGELNNLADKMPGKVAEMGKHLDPYLYFIRSEIALYVNPRGTLQSFL